jgi:hypothetical protein
MKISQETSERLVIVEQASVSGYLMSLGCSIIFLPFALSFLAIPGIINNIFVGETLKCERIEPTQVKCQLRENSLINVTGAKVAEIEGDDTTTYLLQLYSKGHTENFVDFSRNSNKATQVSEQINNFIGNLQQRDLEIAIKGDIFSNLVVVFIVVFFSMMGILGISCNMSSLFLEPLKAVWDFDKAQYKLTVTKCFIHRKTKNEYSLLGFTTLVCCQSHFNLANDKEENIVLDFYIPSSEVKAIRDKFVNFLMFTNEQLIIEKSFSRKETWNFFVNERKLRLVRFGKDTIAEYSLLGKVNFEIDDSQKDSDGDTIYQLFLVLDSGEKVNFDSSTNEERLKYDCNLIQELVLSRIKQ